MKKRKIEYSSQKRFKGSKDSDFYSEGYFLRGEGSNYGRVNDDGEVLFSPYTEEAYYNGRLTVARSMRDRLPRFKKVLVLGCARGYLVKAFRDIGFEAYGVDISEWAIEQCAKGVEEYVLCGDICDLSKWADNEFDLVIALDVLEHITVPDLYKALDEAVRVGRMMCVDVPIAPDDSKPDQSDGTDKSHVSIYSKEWWIYRFLERGQELFKSQPYVYDEVKEESPWPDKRDHAVTLYFRETIPLPTVENAPRIIIARKGKEFKILWWGNAPYTPTGYGVGADGLVYAFNEKYDVSCLCTYGLEGRALKFGNVEGRNPGSNLRMFPKLFEPVGGDAADLIITSWEPDVVITLFDIWVGEGGNQYTSRGKDWLRKMIPYWIAYAPIDHDPVPYKALNQCRQADQMVTMSQFGKRALRDMGVGSTYIPHGTWTDIFKPTMDKEHSVKTLLEYTVPLIPDGSLEWSPDDFIIGINAANKDTKRKGYDRMFKALNHFFDNNPDAKKDVKVHIHSWNMFPGGFPLNDLAFSNQVHPIIQITHKYHMYTGISTSRMASLYQAYDVFFNMSRNEGFGIPIIEAAASGVPSIATNFTSMTELVEGHGWLANPITHDITPLLSFVAIPNEYEAAEHLEDAYNHPEKVKDYGRKAREFSLNYDWEAVVQPLWFKLLEEVREDLRLPESEERLI